MDRTEIEQAVQRVAEAKVRAVTKKPQTPGAIMTHTTQAAARCADLANAEAKNDAFEVSEFEDHYGICACMAFRRYVERIDARDREVLASLGRGTVDGDRHARDLLRADLLPEPQPTLLEEYRAAHPDFDSRHTFHADGVIAALDWIAKRQENEA